MSKQKILSATSIILLLHTVWAQTAIRAYEPTSTSTERITIDGVLNEKVWLDESSPWSSDFVQRLPNEGMAPSQQTKFKIQYDDQFLYVAIICEEERLHEINHWMSRRDGYNGDWVEIVIDSYHDKRTAMFSKYKCLVFMTLRKR